MTTQVDPALERARKHVTEVRDFYYHLMVFLLVNAMLIALDLRTGPNDFFLGLDWSFWVLFGWGFGLLGHAVSVFFGDFRVQQIYEEEKRRELEIR
ncbi:MAG: 2TM domain-containing protein [Acidimicrobiia bacterium]|nr:2TM domain-containing protein [Acidimicrobiia bacterium]